MKLKNVTYLNSNMIFETQSIEISNGKIRLKINDAKVNLLWRFAKRNT